jgi:hypothetical protein
MLAQHFGRVVMWISLHHVFLIADLLRRKVLPEKGKRRGLGVVEDCCLAEFIFVAV